MDTLGHVYTQEKHTDIQHIKNTYMSNTNKQSLQHKEESSVAAAPSAMTPKGVYPSHHDKMAAIVKSRDLKHHDTVHLPCVTT